MRSQTVSNEIQPEIQATLVVLVINHALRDLYFSNIIWIKRTLYVVYCGKELLNKQKGSVLNFLVFVYFYV